MKKVTLTIKSGSTSTVVKPRVFVYEAETIVKAVGLALKGAFDEWNEQYPDPLFFINDILLNKKIGQGNIDNIVERKNLAYQGNFAVIRMACIPFYLTTEQDGVDFIRAVDKTGQYKSQKEFTEQQVAIVVEEATRKAKIDRTCDKWDAKAALWSKDDFERKLRMQKQKEQFALMAPATPKKLKQK
jgi:hypothetical protein